VACVSAVLVVLVERGREYPARGHHDQAEEYHHGVIREGTPTSSGPPREHHPDHHQEADGLGEVADASERRSRLCSFQPGGQKDAQEGDESDDHQRVGGNGECVVAAHDLFLSEVHSHLLVFE
jgi:hypothetical protein